MLINLTNHPSSSWGAEQREAAAEYGGGVVDVPFPTVEAVAGGDEVALLAGKYADEIAGRYTPGSDTVHVMGEMTFTYALVRRLRERGFRCVASTTERVKRQLPDGSFISEFKFQKFRDYE